MRQKQSSRLEYAKIFFERLVFFVADKHRQHRFVDDDIETCVFKRQRERIAVNQRQLIFKMIFLNVCFRFFERVFIEIHAGDLTAEFFRQLNHRPSHIACDFKNFRIAFYVCLFDEPCGRIDSTGAQRGFAQLC